MNPTIPVEQRLLEAIRVLAPDKQQAVLDFAEFLQSRQGSEENIESPEATPFFGSEEKASTGTVNLAECGIDRNQAAELRSRLQTFAEDWERPEMAVYDEL